ncbi:2-polyprenyl-6-methoxyphenol hydroxylase-like oxidoreductase protein [Colletotrichum tofieldiae]|nr:2-polyprenyl-6-methoxyphenol hydroxylase-like oxidoreductase protein [Colletotrichum tofieldiae]GKT75466.1 2-polyprenyl-6-methoxyphenol hydroxylase-like oxidoreductase protein [Colletotrichum tofieldiae]
MRVLISGAGIAGPTLAWFLARTGARITILEKCPSIPSSGHNVDVNHSAISVMKKMDLIDRLRRYNTTEKGTQFVDSAGRPFAPFPVKAGSSSSPTSEFEILRGDLATILYEETKGHPDIEYLFGTTCSKIVSNEGDTVKIGLSNGQVRDFDLVVAADGQWSNIRKLAFPQDSVTVIDKDMYVVYATIPRLRSDNDWWNIYQALGSRIVTLRPDPHGTIRAMLTRMPCNGAQKRAWQGASRGGRNIQQELARREFRDAGWQAPRVLDAMEQSADYYFQEIKQVRMSKWSSARVVCLGDAAFAPTPLTGMGTSLAIIGGYMLAGELSKLGKGEHPAKALEAYERAFRPYVEGIQKIPWFVPGIAHPATAWKRWLLGACVSGLSKIVAMPWVAKRLFDDTNVDDSEFPLPVYPNLGDESSK